MAVFPVLYEKSSLFISDWTCVSFGCSNALLDTGDGNLSHGITKSGEFADVDIESRADTGSADSSSPSSTVAPGC